ncbi:YgjV family protein [Thalassotalea sp. LPB0316]|uniref:YgjV family protein n=1 Tax=Thalassotalea sp. LPB0316 TaxID=2769490 RepID=UPI0018680630|nr:YgjV family protein [Thalassotalea sp. LPB0316]QOL25353.1 YgjV family protein [Thalassotalea sp. LPB0316]
MNEMFFDIISWLGLALCIGAFFVKDMIKLRLVTFTGCLCLGVYYTHIDVVQGMISNVIILAINGAYLFKFKFNKLFKRGKTRLEDELEYS